MKPGDGRATRAVERNLHRETELHYQAWQKMPLDTLESFVESAKLWLGDKSELARQTIECADWPKLYAHFKDENEDE